MMARKMTMTRTMIILAVIAMRTWAEAGMMCWATWVGDVAPMSTVKMMEMRTTVRMMMERSTLRMTVVVVVVVVVVAAVMVGVHQEGVDRDDGRTMTMPRTLIILAVIAMRTGAEAGMMCWATWVGDVAPMSTAKMMEMSTVKMMEMSTVRMTVVVVVAAVMVGMHQ